MGWFVSCMVPVLSAFSPPILPASSTPLFAKHTMNYLYALLMLMMLEASFLAAQTPSIYTVHPQPKFAFPVDGIFALHQRPSIVQFGDDATTVATVAWLQQELRKRWGDTLVVITPERFQDNPTTPAVLLGKLIPAHRLLWNAAIDTGRFHEGPTVEGYLLHVRPTQIIVGGSDDPGLRYGVATLLQLLDDRTASFSCGSVWDKPDYPIRWVFSTHNLRGNGAITTLTSILDTMAAYKLNGIQQNDFKYAILDQQPDFYFDSVARFRALTAARGIDVIPGVAGIGWSSGLLFHAPNIAEGFPANARYVMDADTARLIADDRVAIPNGGFENTDAKGKLTGWGFYDGQSNDTNVAIDNAIYHGGAQSVRCSNFRTGDQAQSGNCRFYRNVDCQPYRHYLMTAWVRTENLSCDEVRLLAIGSDGNNRTRTLTFTAFGLPATTNGWRKIEVAFNTLEFDHVGLYIGVWGGRSGTVWFDDFQISDGGLTNVLRRDGAPLWIGNASTGKAYVEGIDVAPIHDAVMEANHGEYGPYRPAPTVRRIATGAMHNGDTVEIRFHHPLTTVGNEDGNGSVMVCVSEDSLYALLRDQITRVSNLYSPANFFMGHDEIRSLGRDSACLRRGLSAADLLADNVNRCVQIISAVRPAARTFVWSDMFDSLHNAHADYYLINGDLSGVWGKLPKGTTIVNWNGGEREKSLQFFQKLWFQQVVAPYYDTRNTTDIRAWRLAIEGKQQVDGMMYTTWAEDYSMLRQFAYYAWGAGPYIVHKPVTVSPDSLPKPTDTITFTAQIFPDPYDPSDRIDTAWVQWYSGAGGLPFLGAVPLTPKGNNEWSNNFDDLAETNGNFIYQIFARNRQGIERVTPRFIVNQGASGVATRSLVPLRLRLHPNPAADGVTAQFTALSGGWRLEVVDLLGNVAWEKIGEEGEGQTTIPVHQFAPGAYRCVLTTQQGRTSHGMVVMR